MEADDPRTLVNNGYILRCTDRSRVLLIHCYEDESLLFMTRRWTFIPFEMMALLADKGVVRTVKIKRTKESRRVVLTVVWCRNLGREREYND